LGKLILCLLEHAFTGEEKGKTFSRIFGANTGPLEHFLVKRDVMGPCWLDIADAKMSSTSVSHQANQVLLTVSNSPDIGNMVQDRDISRGSQESKSISR